MKNCDFIFSLQNGIKHYCSCKETKVMMNSFPVWFYLVKLHIGRIKHTWYVPELHKLGKVKNFYVVNLRAKDLKFGTS